MAARQGRAVPTDTETGMKLRRMHLAVLVAVVAAGVGGWALLAGSAPAPVPSLAPVQRGTVTRTVLASGMLEARQLVSVGARVSGQVETLAVALGQQVAAGEVIARIDSQDQQNALLQAEAALAGIEAQIAAKQATLERGERVLARQQALQAQNISSKEALDTATADVLIYRAELDALQAQKASAEVTVSTARVALERTQITAPIAGTVVAILVKQGQMVNAAQSAPTIVKIADLSTMLVKAEISEADVMNVAPGQSVSFTTLGASDRPFQAVVRDIEPAPTEIESSDTISSDRAIYYNGLLEVENPEGRLRIGMTAEVSIELDRAEDVLTVPAAAVKRVRAGHYVEILDPATGAAARREIVAGLSDKVVTEIRDGLAEGERVVTGTAAPASARAGTGERMRTPRMF